MKALPRFYLHSFLCYVEELKFLITRKQNHNMFCISESFNTNIAHQLFDYTITFVNPQH